MVIFAPSEIVRHALHVGHFFVEVMRVWLAFAVPDLLHQLHHGVADVQRDRFGGAQEKV
jgi:hypothetical protein